VKRVSPRLLLVEDDADLRDLLVLALEQKGYDVTSATNGVEALVRLEFDPKPAVILMNLCMPVMPGGELLDALRADPQLGRIPVVILSGATVPAAVARAADAVLAKPFDVDALGTVVDDLVAHGGRTTPAPPVP
jgi:CheY-like chemotaxis protein